MLPIVSALIALGCTAKLAAASLDPIVAKGQFFFFSSNGSQFYMRGVAYQQGVDVDGSAVSTGAYTDPLANIANCKRDIPYLQALGTNTIRVYAVDPTVDHSACMQALDAAGIYVIADLSSPDVAIDRSNPAWTTDLYARYTGVINNLAKYTNTIGFFAGNEVANNFTYSVSSTFVKAAVRDCKQFISQQNYGRWLGVGYATNDDGDTRDNLANFFNCGDQSAAVDFWGYNIYEWCGSSTFQTSGYQARTQFFQNYSVPVFFAEYGCNTAAGGAGRIFQETGELYSSDMNKVWSGGIVYEYFEEANDYGLVTVSGNTVKTLADYNALSTQIAASGYPTGTQSGSYSPSNSPRACPSIQAKWAASDSLPPTPNTAVCDCMYSSLSCLPSAATIANATAVGALFNNVCTLDKKACAGIAANGTSGVYGEFTMCNSTQKLAYVLNQYWLDQNSQASACDFSGQAKLNSGSASVAPSCSSILASASSAISNGPTGTSSGGGSSGTGKNSGNSMYRAGWTAGVADVVIAGYILVSAGVGAAMMLL